MSVSVCFASSSNSQSLGNHGARHILLLLPSPPPSPPLTPPPNQLTRFPGQPPLPRLLPPPIVANLIVANLMVAHPPRLFSTPATNTPNPRPAKPQLLSVPSAPTRGTQRLTAITTSGLLSATNTAVHLQGLGLRRRLPG